MKDWNWFLAAGWGSWMIIDGGVAILEVRQKKFRSDLFMTEDDKNPYLSITGVINENSFVEAHGEPYDATVPDYHLTGKYDQTKQGNELFHTFSLIDGRNLIGIAKVENLKK